GQNEVSKSYAVREIIVRHVLYASFGVGAVWVVYLVKFFWNIDLIPARHPDIPGRPDPWDATENFYICLGVSLVAIGVVAYLIYAKVGIIRHGVEVKGKVIGFSLLRARGNSPVTYEYTFDGNRYEHRIDVKRSEMEDYQKDSVIELLVNSRNPSQ